MRGSAFCLALIAALLTESAPALAVTAPPAIAIRRLDPEGFPLPSEAIRRLGSARFLSAGAPIGMSPDGKTVYSLGGSLKAWDVKTGRLRWQFASLDSYFLKAAMSSDGRSLWVISSIPSKSGGSSQMAIIRFSGTDGNRLGEVVIEDVRLTVQDLSPSGQISALRDWRTVDVLDATTGRVTGSWAAPPGESVVSAALTSDGRRLAIASWAHEQDQFPHSHVRVVDLASGKSEQTFVVTVPRERPWFVLQFKADGQQLYALASPTSWMNNVAADAVIYGWDVRTGEQQFVHSVSSDPGDRIMSPVRTFVVSPDGKTAFVGGDRRPNTAYDLSDGSLRYQCKSGTWSTPSFDRTGETVIIGGPGLVFLNTRTGIPRPGSLASHASTPFELTFTPDGRRVRVATQYGDQVTWDTSTGRELNRSHWTHTYSAGQASRALWSHSFFLPRIARSPAGLVARAIFDPADWNAEENGVIVLTGPDGRERGRLPKYHTTYDELVFSADGRFLIAGNTRHTAVVWDVKAGGKPQVLKLRVKNDSGSIRSGPAFHPCPDGKHIAIHDVNANQEGNGIGSGSWSVGIYDLTTAAEVKRFEGIGVLEGLAWSADGTRLAAVGQVFSQKDGKDGTMFVGDLTSLKPPLPPSRVEGHGSAVALSPDGRTLATTAQGAIRLWEVATGKVRHTFVGHRDAPRLLAFSPDGLQLAAEAADGPVLLWDVAGLLSRPSSPPDAAELARAGADLAADDAEQAFRAVRLLSAFPELAVTLLERHFQPEPKPDAKEIAALIQQLDAPAFAAREKAEARLLSLGESIQPVLRKAAGDAPSLEARARAEKLLNAAIPMNPMRVRAIRAVEVLERIATPASRDLLARWASGAYAGPLAAEAADALKRLAKQHPVNE